MGDSIMASIIRATTTSGLQIAPDNSGSLQLQTNGTTTAVTIDTSQNVGIGTTSPATPLNIVGKSAVATVRYTGRSSDNATTVDFYSNDNATRYGFQYVDNTTIQYYTSASIPLVFGTNNAERMRIDSSGNVLVGATTRTSLSGLSGKFYAEQSASDSVVTLYGTNATPYGMAIGYSTTPNGAGSEFLFCRDATAQRMSVKSNGGIYNYSANNSNLSDIREKTNIELAGSYLDKICAIPVKTFLFNDQTDTDLNLGVIAQDVQTVAPELVLESNWAGKDEPEKLRLSIYQTDLQYALMKCIQEQQTIINDLKARIETLEAK
jgi:hypothetical protein